MNVTPIISNNKYATCKTDKSSATNTFNFAECVAEKISRSQLSQSTAPFSNEPIDEPVKESTIDFSSFAPNISDEVKTAFVEAAKESGYIESERMDYISQIFVQQVENRWNGSTNYNDVFGSTTNSALQVAQEMLSDLENPLTTRTRQGENISAYIEQEKEFYKVFIRKLEELIFVSDTAHYAEFTSNMH